MLRFSKHLGTILILLSLAGFSFVMLPFLLSRLPTKQTDVAGRGYFISIAKINASSPIVVGVDPWNKSEYETALSRGIAQAKGTVLPGQSGLIYLFAHSSGMPWEILDKNTPFLRIGELQEGDEISLYRNGKRFAFSVTEKKVVSAFDTHYLKKHENVLILQTCWPIGTDWKRLLVFAAPVQSD